MNSIKSGLSKLPARALRACLPSIYEKLLTRGIIHEGKWVDLKLGHDGEKASYLRDEHRNRVWYCDFVGMLDRPSVLEIGAGGMYEVDLLRRRGVLSSCDYHIIDISREVLEIGRSMFPEVKFRDGSINRVPFPDGSFDVVYCRHVIEHQPIYEKPIREMLRVSKKAVIINLFRWTLGKTVISRVKKYSNSYNVFELLGFCRNSCKRAEHFILLKGKEPGANKYDDLEVVRSGDHMVLYLLKDDGASDSELLSSLDLHKEHLIMNPYDYDPPKYQARPKA